MGILPRSGVYAIVNILDEKRYIGSTDDLQHRRSQHFSDLRYSRHHSVYLQRAYDKYGANAFRFEVVELCAVELLAEREQFWINHYQSFGVHGYNMRPIAESNRGQHFSEEVRARMSAGYNRNRALMNADSRARGDMTRRGVSRSDEARQRMRDGWARRKLEGLKKAVPVWNKLPRQKVCEVVHLIRAGYRDREISRMTGIGAWTIGNIRNRRSTYQDYNFDLLDLD